MLNTILSRLPLCIEYSEFAYKVPLCYDQAARMESWLQLLESLQSAEIIAEQQADLL